MFLWIRLIYLLENRKATYSQLHLNSQLFLLRLTTVKQESNNYAPSRHFSMHEKLILDWRKNEIKKKARKLPKINNGLPAWKIALSRTRKYIA